ncbi:hypothetical protein BDA99DRAFT_537322 [Phascolomyces articulosus]|uniref:Uncharacterized protein n=1 Tax=Phascolomyces articulosus TaxID=60185 RepID=A0AAD5K0Q6_9FUNG|nr:hypothetical protein BDA99DRAFT_537322 [Phascolomyces articulosus]
MDTGPQMIEVASHRQCLIQYKAFHRQMSYFGLIIMLCFLVINIHRNALLVTVFRWETTFTVSSDIDEGVFSVFSKRIATHVAKTWKSDFIGLRLKINTHFNLQNNRADSLMRVRVIKGKEEETSQVEDFGRQHRKTTVLYLQGLAIEFLFHINGQNHNRTYTAIQTNIIQLIDYVTIYQVDSIINAKYVFQFSIYPKSCSYSRYVLWIVISYPTISNFCRNKKRQHKSSILTLSSSSIQPSSIDIYINNNTDNP